MTKTTDKLSFDQNNLSLLYWSRWAKGKSNETANYKDLPKSSTNVIQSKDTVRYKVKKHGTWYDLNKKNVCNLDYKQWFH